MFDKLIEIQKNLPQSRVLDALIFLAVAILIYWALLTILRNVPKIVSQISLRFGSTSNFSEILLQVADRTKKVFLALLAIYFTAIIVPVPANTFLMIHRSLMIIGLIQVAIWILHGINIGREIYISSRSDDGSQATAIRALSLIVKLGVIVSLFLCGLDNLGINVTSLLAGLGVGGIAVALALQNLLGDLFASFTIVLDKPFVIGDALVIGEFSGTVEHIGLKTTRIRSVSGEQVVFANSDLLQSRIRNYKRMIERRVTISVGVTYQTSAETLEKIPAILRQIIENQSKIRFDRSHFCKMGESSLDFDAVYFVLNPDFNVHMDIQQKIYLDIYRQFTEAKIEFAYPSRSLYIR